MKIGIIGLGDMGKLFASNWADLGYDVYGSDKPENIPTLINNLKNVTVLKDAKTVSETCDIILYAVETENIDKVVQEAGPYTKAGAIVSGQTSVKTPEVKAFEKHLPENTEIVGSHALFGPSISPNGQTIAMYKHRCSEQSFEVLANLFRKTGAIIEELDNYKVHDSMMADIQVITHVGFESLGTAFMHRKVYPWEGNDLTHGLDNIKLLLTLRIFSYKPHVYSGLAFENPYAVKDVRKFAEIENELFGLMITGNKEKLKKRIYETKEKVFPTNKTQKLIDDKLLQEFSFQPDKDYKPNSHLSLLTMACTWGDLNIDPYKNMVCQTPPFRLRVGLAEYLFHNDKLLEESLETAIEDKSNYIDDLAYHTAVFEWANILEIGDRSIYEKHFKATRDFLKDRLQEGREKSSVLLNRLKNIYQ